MLLTINATFLQGSFTFFSRAKNEDTLQSDLQEELIGAPRQNFQHVGNFPPRDGPRTFTIMLQLKSDYSTKFEFSPEFREDPS